MSFADIPPPPPIPCAGCGTLIPYKVGDTPSDETCFGEHLQTRTGRRFVRTCWDRACVRASREECGGRPVKVGPTKEDRVREQLGGAT